MKYFLVAAALIVLAGTFAAQRALQGNAGERPAAAASASVYPEDWIRGICRAYDEVGAGPADPAKVGVQIAQTALTFVPAWAPGDGVRTALSAFFRQIDRHLLLEEEAPGTGADALGEAERALADAQREAKELEASLGERLPCVLPAA